MTEDQRDANARGRLPAVHHRRRRHRPRRRSARAQPHPPLRRSGRAGIPHRGPAPGRQEVRTPGRQSAGAVGRADQAPQLGPVPTGHHAGPGHHRRAHRRRGGQPARQLHRRARPAIHPRRHQHCRARLQVVLPRDGATLHNAGVNELNGHLLYAIPEGEYATADAWLGRHGIAELITGAAAHPDHEQHRSTPTSTRSSRSSSMLGRTTPG